MTDTGTSFDMPEFSLVKGGLLYRMFRAVGLCGNDLEFTFRRVAVVVAITWLPMFILSVLEGRARKGADIPFLADVENQVRFLVALPLLLAAETMLERTLSPRIKNFVIRGIIRDADMPKFQSAIRSAARMRDSVLFEALLIVLVYAAGASFYSSMFASQASQTWYSAPDGTNWNLTAAGYWLVFVGLPVFQFLFVRWYFRIFIWFIFLFRVSCLDLNLIPTHSDRAAGLGFLNKCAYAFCYWMIAQGAILSGFIAGQAIHFGANPLAYKVETAGVVILVLATVLTPLALFAPRLIEAKWERGGEFGTFASRYVEDFDSKWIAGRPPGQERLLGTSDLQSLADLGNSYAIVDQTRTVPFSPTDVLYMALMTLAPLIPLLLLVFSLEELLDRSLKILL
ncbi:MAG: hypothetical protein QUS14_06305 [Pyrinomonadaceae bacterium]|nr:hypothetical protein [Pyrinomonadaceae bacterium]